MQSDLENVQDPEATAPVLDDQRTTNPASEPAAHEAKSSRQAPEGQQLPDPASLVAMAALHMQTRDLMEILISVFHAHAWRSMGLVADHAGEVTKDLPSAQTAIDCLAFMLAKIENTLDETEKRDVQRRLTDLRMNYVAKVKEG